MKEKNIWLINHYATSMFQNRSGRHYWFAKYLKRIGYLPVVFCASSFHNKKEGIDTGKELYKLSVDNSENLPFVFVRTRPSIGNGVDRVLNMVDFYRHLFPVSRTIRKKYGKPDVILASSVHPLTMVAGIQIGKRLKVPCICEIRDLWPEAIFAFGKAKENSLIGKLLKAGEYWIYRNADALIFTKEGDTDYLLENKWDTMQGGKVNLNKCFYINNGVDLKTFESQILTETLDDPDLHDENIFKVVYAGAIRPVNSVGNLLDCAHILQEHSNIKFLIYGEGNQRQILEDRAKNENLANVIFKGFVERKHIPYILSKSSVNILNYSQTQYNWTRGNSSNKLFEYMASGKPVISTVKMGYSIIASYGCGIELNQSTPEALADAILKISQLSPEEYQELGANARRGAEDFDFHLLTEKLDSVIQRVLND